MKRSPYQLSRLQVSDNPADMMRSTIRLIGAAIKKGSRDLRIRNYAASVASTAAPKDYIGQAQAIYRDFVRRWRYVKDPVDRELISFSPRALYGLVMGADGVGAGRGYGVGDCDCASAAIGSLYRAVGFPVRLATTSPVGAPSGDTFGHVFIQIDIPKIGWTTADPVLHPHKGFGEITPHSRLAVWGLEGQLIGAVGNYTAPKKKRSAIWDLVTAINSISRLSTACRRMTDF